MKQRNLNVFFGMVAWLMTFTASAGSMPAASDYFLSGEVLPGQKLLINMHYSEFPFSSLGEADGFNWNPGSASLYVASTVTNLYVGDTLAASSTNIGSGYGGLFLVAGTSSLGQAGGMWRTVKADDGLLDAFFSGSMSATLEVVPTFLNVNGRITYSGWGPHAVTFTGSQQWEDIFPAPMTTSSVVGISTPAVFPMPAPPAALLMLTGLGLLGLTKRFRKADKGA